jgi:hypothetical protein
MQGSWVSSPNLSSGPMSIPGYDRMGNSIGVPLRYYDRNANEISASTFSKTNNDLTIKLDSPLSNEFLTMKKRKDDFNNNFKMPEPFISKFKPIEIEPIKLIDTITKYKPMKLLEPEIESFKPINTFKPIKVDTFEPINTFKPFIPEIKPFVPIKIEPIKLIDFDKPKRKSFYDPVSDFNIF